MDKHEGNYIPYWRKKELRYKGVTLTNSLKFSAVALLIWGVIWLVQLIFSLLTS